MILQVRPDSRKVVPSLDAGGLELCAGTDAGAHQQHRRRIGARSQDNDVAGNLDRFAQPLAGNPAGTVALEENRIHFEVIDDREVVAGPDGIHEGEGGVPADSAPAC